MSWVDTFDRRFADAPGPLHALSGWSDITDLTLWERYVADTLGDLCPPGSQVFEAGCGVLAFSSVLHQLVRGDVSLRGVDASPQAIATVRDLVAPPLGLDPDGFRVGQLPTCLHTEADASVDLTVAHSVLQYMPKSTCEATIRELLRMTRPGGALLLGDVCAAEHRAEEELRMARHWPGYGAELPAYTYLSRPWFDRFEGVEAEVRRCDVVGYARRATRVIVVLRVPDPRASTP